MELVDTDVLIDVQRGQPPALAWFSGLAKLPAVPGFVVMELVRNARNARRAFGLVSPLQIVWPTHVDCARALSDLPRTTMILDRPTFQRGRRLPRFNAYSCAIVAKSPCAASTGWPGHIRRGGRFCLPILTNRDTLRERVPVNPSNHAERGRSRRCWLRSRGKAGNAAAGESVPRPAGGLAAEIKMIGPAIFGNFRPRNAAGKSGFSATCSIAAWMSFP